MIIFLCQFFFSPFLFFTSSKRFSRQLHQVERKLAEIRNMALTVDCFFFYYYYYYYYLFAHFLLIHPLKHLLFQLDYRAAANEVEALKEENDLLRRKYVHSKDCRMFPLEIFPWLVALVSSHSPVEQKRHPFAIRHSPLATHETSKKLDGSNSLLVYPFKPQDPHTIFPDWSPYISLKNSWENLV